MEEEILNEITNFCEECASHECCLEDECILYRIEQIVLKKDTVPKIESSCDGQTTIDDYL